MWSRIFDRDQARLLPVLPPRTLASASPDRLRAQSLLSARWSTGSPHKDRAYAETEQRAGDLLCRRVLKVADRLGTTSNSVPSVCPSSARNRVQAFMNRLFVH